MSCPSSVSGMLFCLGGSLTCRGGVYKLSGIVGDGGYSRFPKSSYHTQSPPTYHIPIHHTPTRLMKQTTSSTLYPLPSRRLVPSPGRTSQSSVPDPNSQNPATPPFVNWGCRISYGFSVSSYFDLTSVNVFLLCPYPIIRTVTRNTYLSAPSSFVFPCSLRCDNLGTGRAGEKRGKARYSIGRASVKHRQSIIRAKRSKAT